MTDEFSDQFIEGDNTPVKKTNGKPQPVPRATKEALLQGKLMPREEIREVLAQEVDEVDPDLPLPDKPNLAALLTDDDKAVIAQLSTQDEKIIAHALEILPHLGPEVTAAYLASASGGQHAQHE